MRNRLWALFLTFLKVNLLTSSGPTSAGLIYAETVGKLLTHEEFTEAVGYSSVLPGSDALQLAMFIGYRVSGVPGALLACLGAVLPPTVIMLAVAALLTRLRGEAWIGNFVKGLAPALAALLLITAYHLLGEGQERFWPPLILGIVSLLALTIFKVSPTLVLLAAGIAGIIWFR